MSQALEESSIGAVPQQGAVPPLLQGRPVGHMPDAQVPGLDVIVTRVLVVIAGGRLCRPKGVVIGPVAISLGVVGPAALLTRPAVTQRAFPSHVILVHTGHQGPASAPRRHVTEGLVDDTILSAEEIQAITCSMATFFDFLAAPRQERQKRGTRFVLREPFHRLGRCCTLPSGGHREEQQEAESGPVNTMCFMVFGISTCGGFLPKIRCSEAPTGSLKKLFYGIGGNL